ncbi:hypothetical protein D9757_012406 [Collybiopsis confluens]|uniref:Uncharacterized protein n=1 Tax=Collybiopsis confluens TaxID=2823264 RepID=A0A8H5LYT2_9AGAR|nr:hypothetical protein D9757_012406 [Collybiopsis confluens]
MAPYDDWNKYDDDQDNEEPQDNSVSLSQVILSFFSFTLEPDDPENEREKTSHLFAALNSAMQLQKRRVITGPNDSFGTFLFNTDRQAEIDKSTFVYGMAAVGANTSTNDENIEEEGIAPTKIVKPGQKPFYTPEEMKSFRSFGLEPGFKLFGFKPRKELKFEDNVKHSLFIYPEENVYILSSPFWLSVAHPSR